MEQIIRRDPFTYSFKIVDVNVDTLVETPVDLTGRTVVYTLKRQDDEEDNDTNALIKREILLNNEDAENGIVNIYFDSIETDLDPSTYDLEVDIRNGTSVITYIQDKLKITKKIIKG